MSVRLPYDKLKTKPEKLFKRVDEVERRSGLKVVIVGGPGVGKTHFGCTGPPPVRIIDTQFGAWPVAKKFVVFQKDYTVNKTSYKANEEAVIPTKLVDDLLQKEVVKLKDIEIFDCQHVSPKSDQPDAIQSLENVETAVNALVSMTSGTIVIDSFTDIYPVWCQAWLEATATIKSKKTGEMIQLEWGRATDRIRKWLIRLKTRPCHLIITAQEHPARGVGGADLGYNVPHWHQQIPYWTDVVLQVEQVKEKQQIVKTYTRVIKCRWERVPGDRRIEDITWPKLTELLEEEYGVKVTL